jgi:cellulose synthase operon protein C
MPVSPFVTRIAAALICGAVLTGCQSSEEKAEGHFASAQQLLAEGDVARALVELRNVLSFKPDHADGRRLLSETMQQTGDLPGAYANFLALVEQLPGDLEARLAVARIQLSQSKWSELARTIAAAEKIKADDPRVQAFGLVRDYQAAIEAGNDVKTASLARRAETLLITQPGDPALLRVVIDRKINGVEAATAMPLIDEALTFVPQDYGLQSAKLRLLIEAEDGPGVVAQMDRMMALFPTDTVLPAARLQWHLTRGETAEAEAFLRQRAGARDGETQPQVELVEFLRATGGQEAALAELEQLVAANGTDVKAELYRAMRASIIVETQDRAAALADLADIVAKAQPSDQSRNIKALYATLLARQGEIDKADALVAEILKEDAAHK